MNGTTRELLARVEAIGWHFVGYDGNTHVRLRHEPTGQTASIPATPSDYRSGKNALAMLERMGGQKLPRVNHRRSRKAPLPGEDPEVMASRRRHEQAWTEKETRRLAAERAKADDKRRRDIEDLMR